MLFRAESFTKYPTGEYLMLTKGYFSSELRGGQGLLISEPIRICKQFDLKGLNLSLLG